MKLKRDMWQVTSDGKESAARLAPSCHASPVTRHAHGVALVITVILIAVVTFMAITFLAISRRERGAVTTTTDTITAQLAADDALAAAEAQIVAHTLATTNPYNFGLLVSTNYINSYGFVSGVADPTNVSYYYHVNGKPVSKVSDFVQLLANLQYQPRAPVMMDNNDPVQGRFYLDLNRNGVDDTNGVVGDFDNNRNYNGDISEVGDPEWIGVLQHPDQPYGPNNPFVARYAFVAVPIGNALDLNAIHNQVFDGLQLGTTNVNPSPFGAGLDGYYRNQGVGSWEINLAAFLADLNTNEWLLVQPPNVKYYYYLWQSSPPVESQGVAFNDARALLAYRYANDYSTLAPVAGNPNGLFTLANTFPPFQDNIDYYSDGPLMTTPAGINAGGQSVTIRWAGADNMNHFFDMQELFDPNKANIGAATSLNSFTNRLTLAGRGTSTYNRYTYYRLLSQMGVDSAPESGKMDLNYDNLDPYVHVVNGNFVTNAPAATNFMSWTALGFFTNAADRMLRAYSQEWLEENPTNYLVTYGMYTNIGNVNFPTNVPVPFGISDIPVLVSNQFVYTPAIQHVLQLAANMYDATTDNTAVMGMNFPSVFRPIFLVTNNLVSGYRDVYISGYEPVQAPGSQQIGTVSGPNDPQLALPVDVTSLSAGSGVFGAWAIYTNVNVYGVPWIVGAKKGFPNFNEFAMDGVFQLTRKLQVTRPLTNSPLSDYQYNQMFNLSLSNEFAVECWNSYTNPFTRSVAIYVNCTNSCLLTNDEGFSTNLSFQSLGVLQTNFWPGYGNVYQPNPQSFQIPLDVNFPAIPTSTYRFADPSYPYHLTTNLDLPYETGITFNGQPYPQPHWWLSISNDVRVITLDTQTGPPYHIIDYVQLAGPNSYRDLTSEILQNYDTGSPSKDQGDDLWDTNRNSQGIPYGIGNLLAVCWGLATPSAGSGTWDTQDETKRENEIDGFRAFFAPLHMQPLHPGNAGEADVVAEDSMTNAVQAPYTPTATMIQVADWQVNDPLVHYLANDVGQPGVEPPFRAPPPVPTATNIDYLTSSSYATIGSMNIERYMPWGIAVQASGVDANPYHLAIKDPLVRQSDDWDFPTYKLPTVGWLGRVHRGTPWQTVYLKSPDILGEIQVLTNFNTVTSTNIGTNTWVWWTGDSQFRPGPYYNTNYDAVNTAPAQDRLLFDLFTTAPNDNATRGQLSVNVGASDPNNSQAGLAAWSALLSGVEVLSNNAADSAINPAIFTPAQHNGSLLNYTAFPINPAGPGGATSPLGRIVAGINATRANANNAAWISSMQVLVPGRVAIANEIPATFVNLDGLTNTFEHVGDILAVPQLSAQSPFLNTDVAQQQNGISDEMYDWLPQQVLSLLRVSGTPQSPMRYVIYSYGQALKPAAGGIYTGGGSFFGMATNYQVVAESAKRALVNFGSVETNFVTVTSDGFGNQILNSVPAVTNNTAQVQQYNVLPPY